MQEKERMKRQLERKVESLKLQLNSEKKQNDELELEYQRKIEKLEQRIEQATGGAKAELLQQLKQMKESKEALMQKTN